MVTHVQSRNLSSRTSTFLDVLIRFQTLLFINFFCRAGLLRLFSGKRIAAGPDSWVTPLSNKRLSPSNQADLQHLNRYSIWIASTKQVGIIWIRGSCLLSANLHTRGELVIQIYSRLILLPKTREKWGALFELRGKTYENSVESVFWGGGTFLKFIFGLSVYPEEILLALSGTISVS